MAFVEFRDVSKVYQMGEVEVAAVRDMSFQIEQGESWGRRAPARPRF